MRADALLLRWLDIRPGELRPFFLSFCSAFCVIAFLILSRSLREALYLARFDVTTLPYITVGVALLGLPTVALFSRVLSRHSPRRALSSVLILLAVGVGLLWPLVFESSVAVVIFYLWTSLGTLVLTSGFWIVTSEHFALRGAKRLFGLISGGGTLGAIAGGMSLGWLIESYGTAALFPALIALLGALWCLQQSLPSPGTDLSTSAPAESTELSMRRGVNLIGSSPHLRTLALIVLLATMASTLLDFRFKEHVRIQMSSTEELAGFFGTFYGVAGAIALAIQVLLASRLLALGGVAISLTVLPLLLLLVGSIALLTVPGLLVVTLLRGGDYSLRKSLHRSVIEVLFIPLPALLRRKTKTFIDSVVDSSAEGVGALVIFLCVTIGGLSSDFLSLVIFLIALCLLWLARSMGFHYVNTLKQRLRQGWAGVPGAASETLFDGKNLLTATLTHFDLQQQLVDSGLSGSSPAHQPNRTPGPPKTRDQDTRSDLERRLASSDPEVIERTLQHTRNWQADDVPGLLHLLSRSRFYESALDILVAVAEYSLPPLTDMLCDEDADFVLRRRIPRVLAEIDDPRVDDALLEGLHANRFEVRYRSAVALAKRRRSGLARADDRWIAAVWRAVRREVSHERPIWELQRLLDGEEAGVDNFVSRRVGRRGELSLEHTFRMLSLILDVELVRTAFHSLLSEDVKLESIALEYWSWPYPRMCAKSSGPSSVMSANISAARLYDPKTTSSPTCLAAAPPSSSTSANAPPCARP